MVREQMKSALLVFILLTILTGVAYPLLITAVARSAWYGQAHGSLIVRGGKVCGSTLIGQSFDDPKYLWGRLSATGPVPYNAAASSGSNLGPLNPALRDTAKTRIDALRAADPGNRLPIPVDLVTSSASGLDPHISLAGAYYQVRRIAKQRRIPEAAVKEIILRHTIKRPLGVLGEPVVSVLEVNLDLDAAKK